MLQKNLGHSTYDAAAQGLDFGFYLEILKARILFLLVPFVLVFVVGFAVTMLLPPIFVSEGKILVETQQIPVELVRPTVTATARERLQVLQQRVMSRENLLAIVDKFQLFADQRQTLSGTELVDLMRSNTRFLPVQLDQQRGAAAGSTIALTVGFENRRPDLAMRVANELMTLLLREDARNRTNRAEETTKFLAREVRKLEGELGAIEAPIAELKRRPVVTAAPSSPFVQQLTLLQADLQAKSLVYSGTHPEIIRLKQQIEALEKVTAPAQAATPAQADNSALEALLNQRASIQKSLEAANQKLSIATIGETLERDQYSERLQVLEQATVPQRPIKPNRPKMLALVFALAVAAGGGGIVAVEALNRTIRGSRDLVSLVDSRLVVAIPYIATTSEVSRKKRKIVWTAFGFVTIFLAGLAAVHLLLRPLDQLWTVFLARMLP